MDRKQKIKALELIAKGTPTQKAVKLACMPEIMVVFSNAEADALELSGYDGKVIHLVTHIPDGKGGFYIK